MRCPVSVSQNQSAESSVSSRKRRSFSARRDFSRDDFLRENVSTAYTTPPESSASRTASSTWLAGVADRRRHLEHFLDGGEARADFHRAADAQRFHAFLERLVADRREIRLFVHQLLDLVAEEQRLVDAHASHEAGHAALEAAHRLVDLRPAGGLSGPHQAVPRRVILRAVESGFLLP